MWSIYAYGDGVNLFNQLSAIKMMAEHSGYFPLIVTISAMLSGMYVAHKTGNFGIKRMVIILILSGAIHNLFLKEGVIDVVIEDERTGYANGISGLPTGLVIVLGGISTIEYETTKWIETYYSTPNSLALTKSGMGFAMGSELVGNDAMIRDTNLLDSWKYYYYNCIRADLSLRNITSDDIKRSSDLLSILAPTTSMETLIFDGTDPQGTQKSCSEAWTYISPKIPTAAQEFIDNEMTARMNMTVAGVNNALSSKNSLLYGVGASASKSIEQQMIRNLLEFGHLESAKIIGGDAITSAYSDAIAKRTNRENWTRTGQQALDNLPMIRNVYYALFVGFFLLLAIISGALMSGKIFLMGVSFLFSLALWNPIGTIMNFHYFNELENYIPAFAYLGNELTIYKMDRFSEKSADMLAFMTSIFAMLPALAVMILNGSAVMMGRVIESGMGTNAGVNQTAEELARGNTSTGNAQHDNTNIGNIRTNATEVHTPSIVKTNASGADTTNSMGTASDGSSAFKKEAFGNTLNTTSSTGTSSFNENGELLAATSPKLIANTTEQQQSTQSKLNNEVMSASKAYTDAVSSSLAHTMGEGTQVNKVEKLSHTTGIDTSKAEEIVKATETATAKSLDSVLTDEQKREVFDTAGIEVSVNSQGGGLIGEAFKALTGLSVNAKGELSYIDKDGESHSMQLSSKQSEVFKETQSQKFNEMYRENESLQKAIDTSYTSNTEVGNSHTRSASHSYQAAKTELESFTKGVGYVESNGASVSKDISTKMIDELTKNQFGSKYTNGGADTKASMIQTTLNKISKNEFSKEDMNTAYKNAVSAYGGVSDNTKPINVGDINDKNIPKGEFKPIDKPELKGGNIDSKINNDTPLNKDTIRNIDNGKEKLQNSKNGTSEQRLDNGVEMVKNGYNSLNQDYNLGKGFNNVVGGATHAIFSPNGGVSDNTEIKNVKNQLNELTDKLDSKSESSKSTVPTGKEN